MNLSGVSRKKAFLGSITTEVRDKAWQLCSGAGTVLDVCCGNGLFFLHTKIEAKSNGVFVGVDRSEVLLKEAKKIFQDNHIEGIHLARADAFQLPFRTETFDRIVCVNTLLNLPSLEVIEKLLVEMMRICSHNGKIIIDVRNHLNPFIRFRYRMHAWRQKFTVKAYKAPDISDILKRHGFHFLSILPVGCPLTFVAKAFLIEAGRIK